VSRGNGKPGSQVRHFRLPRKLVNREEYIVAACRGRRVLHVGRVDYVRSGTWQAMVEDERWLHRRIRDVATETIGIDVQRAAVEEIRDKLGMTDIHWGDAERLEQLDLGTFDVIIAGEVIEHLPNPGAMFASAHAVLREGGELIVTAPNAFCARKSLGVLLGRESVHEDHVAYYSHRTLARVAEVHGYQVVEQCSYRLPNRRPWLPYVLERLACLLSPNLCEGIICRMQQARGGH